MFVTGWCKTQPLPLVRPGNEDRSRGGGRGGTWTASPEMGQKDGQVDVGIQHLIYATTVMVRETIGGSLATDRDGAGGSKLGLGGAEISRCCPLSP